MLRPYNFIFLLFVVALSVTACESAPKKNVVTQMATPITIPPTTTATTMQQHESAVDYIVVQKADRVISLWKNGRIVKTYPILAYGADPYGHKVREGDEKTPEGTYYIDRKHPSKQFQKFLNISYPNEVDRANAQRLGVPAGGSVGIHGDKGGLSGFFQRMDKNWTDGCIAVRNADIEDIYAKVDVGTTIMIKP